MKPDVKKIKLYESALIKAIRRCDEEKAISFCAALCLLGYVDIVWRRIFIHLSEDIGLANKTLPAIIYALYQNYKILSDEQGRTSYESDNVKFLPVAHSVLLLANSQKSRAVEDVLICEFNLDNWEEKKIADYCIDLHSPRGRREGKGIKHFLSEAAKIKNEGKYQNLWKTKAGTFLLEKEKIIK